MVALFLSFIYLLIFAKIASRKLLVKNDIERITGAEGC